jgi:hypothetical protein
MLDLLKNAITELNLGNAKFSDKEINEIINYLHEMRKCEYQCADEALYSLEDFKKYLQKAESEFKDGKQLSFAKDAYKVIKIILSNDPTPKKEVKQIGLLLHPDKHQSISPFCKRLYTVWFDYFRNKKEYTLRGKNVVDQAQDEDGKIISEILEQIRNNRPFTIDECRDYINQTQEIFKRVCFEPFYNRASADNSQSYNCYLILSYMIGQLLRQEYDITGIIADLNNLYYPYGMKLNQFTEHPYIQSALSDAAEKGNLRAIRIACKNRFNYAIINPKPLINYITKNNDPDLIRDILSGIGFGFDGGRFRPEKGFKKEHTKLVICCLEQLEKQAQTDVILDYLIHNVSLINFHDEKDYTSLLAMIEQHNDAILASKHSDKTKIKYIKSLISVGIKVDIPSWQQHIVSSNYKQDLALIDRSLKYVASHYLNHPIQDQQASFTPLLQGYMDGEIQRRSSFINKLLYAIPPVRWFLQWWDDLRDPNMYHDTRYTVIAKSFELHDNCIGGKCYLNRIGSSIFATSFKPQQEQERGPALQPTPYIQNVKASQVATLSPLLLAATNER